MKDQYFGDARDYLKYMLLEEIVRNVSGRTQLTSITMLTAPDATGQGKVHFPKGNNDPLANFLTAQLNAAQSNPTARPRQVRNIRNYFAQSQPGPPPLQPIPFTPIGDIGPPYFSNAGRNQYFSSINPGLLLHAVVFLDPDNGIATGTPNKRHVTVAELLCLWSRMDDEGVLVVYQHRQRKSDFYCGIATTLSKAIRKPGYIVENDVAFYVLPKKAIPPGLINNVLKKVAAVPGCSRSFVPV